jgi:WhiB family transcriptional regulator, redox-sensing transcriptional regulator
MIPASRRRFDHAPAPTRPITEAWEWQLQAHCRTVDPELFFHPENERGNARKRREARAKEVCSRCPVRRECQLFALEADEQFGVWGGVTEDERVDLVRRMTPPTTANARRRHVRNRRADRNTRGEVSAAAAR